MSTRRAILAAALSAVALGVPLEERQSCGRQWDQCGGTGFTGATCCVAGTTCVAQNQWYSQCLPGQQQGNPTTSSAPPTRTSLSSVIPPTTSVATSVQSSQRPGTTVQPTTTRGNENPGNGATASYVGNPFSGVQMWANDYYASEISSLAMPSLSPALATKAASVAKVPTFEWFDIAAKVPTRLAKSLSDIRAANKAGASPPFAGLFVVYDLPDRDCAAAASNGEYSIANGGVANYKKYIDSIRAQLLAYPDVRSLLVIEPDSLANMITNLNVPKCQGAQAAYMECTQYAIKNLDLPNVAMYLDAGHAGWLGWEANLPLAATMYAKVYTDAGKPKALRGLATNVANYNGWNLTSPPPYTQGNAIYDEQRYVKALQPLLKAGGWDAHFITDQGRSGRQPTGQNEWGDWCNQKGTGFGIRPTANTGLDIQDAFVWIKPGGECDGTSDQSAARYDYHCGAASALKPAPEAGQWFQAYFEQLLVNANPAF